MSEKTKNKDCPCYSVNCSRHGYCKECQENHSKKGSRTSCGK